MVSLVEYEELQVVMSFVGIADTPSTLWEVLSRIWSMFVGPWRRQPLVLVLGYPYQELERVLDLFGGGMCRVAALAGPT